MRAWTTFLLPSHTDWLPEGVDNSFAMATGLGLDEQSTILARHGKKGRSSSGEQSANRLTSPEMRAENTFGLGTVSSMVPVTPEA